MPASKNKRKSGKVKKFNSQSNLRAEIAGYNVLTQKQIDHNNKMAMIDIVSK